MSSGQELFLVEMHNYQYRNLDFDYSVHFGGVSLLLLGALRFPINYQIAVGRMRLIGTVISSINVTNQKKTHLDNTHMKIQ